MAIDDREYTPYAMGKTEARPDAVTFSFLSYFSKSDLPTPPKVFGVWQHFWNIKMFKNDKIGDCVWAGAANETSSWYRDVAKWVEFMDDGVVGDYSAVTGYVPGNKDTDKGTDMGKAAEYRRQTGILDRYGRRHHVDAYVRLRTGNFDELVVAMYLFGAVGIGLLCPDYFQKDFDRGEPWDVKPSKKMLGGHYIPGCGIDQNGDIVVITWGKYHRMTRAFFEKYNDESVCFFTFERTMNRTSPEGFHASKLLSDLRELKKPFGYSGGFDSAEKLLDIEAKK
jgi:hypothetical protein